MGLLVVGNGIDIAFKYPTKLINCDKWLRNKSQINHRIKLQLSYIQDHYKGLKAHHNDLWKDVENNLMKVDDPPKNINNDKWYNQTLWLDIKECFITWVNHICKYVNNYPPKIDDKNRKEYELIKHLLRSSDLLFDFNYTDTFKRYFNVPENKIIHIHGTKNDPILGHKGKEIIHDVHSKNTFYDMTLKNTHSCFYNEKNISKFSKIHPIHKIIFIGLSYGKVDWPYYRYMKNEHFLAADCIGIFYYHCKKIDLKSAKKLCGYLHNLHIIKNGPKDKQYFKPD